MLYVNQIDLSTWTKGKDIIKALQGIAESKDISRTFRSEVAINNRMYLNGDADHYIVHGGKGYKWASSEAEIVQSIHDLEKRAFTMLKAVNSTRKALNEKGQGNLLNSVAEVRKEKKMTAEQLCKTINEAYPGLNLDASLLSRIETGKVLPNHMTMVAISEALGVGAVKLFGASALLI